MSKRQLQGLRKTFSAGLGLWESKGITGDTGRRVEVGLLVPWRQKDTCIFCQIILKGSFGAQRFQANCQSRLSTKSHLDLCLSQWENTTWVTTPWSEPKKSLSLQEWVNPGRLNPGNQALLDGRTSESCREMGLDLWLHCRAVFWEL